MYTPRLFPNITTLTRTLLPLRYCGYVALAIGVSLLLLFPEPISSAADSPFTYQNPSEGINQLRIQNHTLSVDLKDAFLEKVLEQISRQGNIRVVHEAPLEKRVTILFNALPIDQGLKKILRGQDIIFLYSKTEEKESSAENYQLKEVRLIGQKIDKEGSRPVSTASASVPRKEPASKRPVPQTSSRDRRDRPPPPAGRTPPPPPVKNPDQAERALSGIMEGNVDAFQDLVKTLQQDNPQLQQQIDQFMESFGDMREQTEKEGIPPPPLDNMGPVGPIMDQMLKDRSVTLPPDVQEQLEKALSPTH